MGNSDAWGMSMDERMLRKKRREIGFLLFMWLAPAVAAGTLAGLLP
jgi:hypothetical protein